MSNTIDELTDQLYKNISLRILNKKNELKKKRYQITDDNNIQLLSNIMHNKRIPNRNPYLLNHKIICDLISTLNFKSSYYLIWGENEELDLSLRSLFEYSLNFLQEVDNSNETLIENCLLEYLPYAKLSAELNYSLEPIKPDTSDVEYANNVAVEHLYYGISNSLKDKHKKFFENKETKKLPQNIIKFISKIIPQLLNQYLNDRDNQGQKAYSIMSKIINYESENEFDNISHGPEWYPHQPLSNTGRPLMEVRQDVIYAGNKYIDQIINEQKETDPFYLDYSNFI